MHRSAVSRRLTVHRSHRSCLDLTMYGPQIAQFTSRISCPWYTDWTDQILIPLFLDLRARRIISLICSVMPARSLHKGLFICVHIGVILFFGWICLTLALCVRVVFFLLLLLQLWCLVTSCYRPACGRKAAAVSSLAFLRSRLGTDVTLDAFFFFFSSFLC